MLLTIRFKYRIFGLLCLVCQVLLCPSRTLGEDSLGPVLNREIRKLEEEVRTLKEQLVSRFEKDSPRQAELIRSLYTQPYEPGYQQLPSIVRDAEQSGRPSPPQPRTYSWDLAHTLVRAVRSRLEKFPKKRDPHSLTTEFREVFHALRLARRHVSYNEVWQAHAANPAYRDYFRVRNQLFEAVTTGGKKDFVLSYTGLTQPRPYVKAEGDTFAVTILTDIVDQKFLETFKRIVEEKWRYSSGSIRCGISLSWTHISPTALYSPGTPPLKGAALNVDEHVRHFPRGLPILTTGAPSTYCLPNGTCVLGPEPLAPNVLAHEFGHLLGFEDAYLRAPRPLSGGGFEIREIEIDSSDIMSNPATGTVSGTHCESLRRHYAR